MNCGKKIMRNVYHIETMQLVYLITPFELSFNVEWGKKVE